ncbi:HCO3- transporter family protein [Nitzschia inconspicua]|uniref:HCO3- transporter family protein n=1 Tax=Nitzschia inconspicua TaxID=303405 RepID=A0A9K3Q4X1_9STRA|nr:HCO3- transporter family protein [Nitzschia inconspicua]KAG7371517.1 HCO3- transporter family protein [Nitzschia inconspicua]
MTLTVKAVEDEIEVPFGTSSMTPNSSDPTVPAGDGKSKTVPSTTMQSNESSTKTFDQPGSSKNVTNENNRGDDNDDENNTHDPPLIQFLTGMKDDLKSRIPLYKDDWMGVQSPLKVFNACIFTFIIQLIPALIFAELMDRQTEGNFATAETVLSSGIMGIIYAIFAGQPLVVMGITGPVSLLLGTSYGLAAQFDAEYFPFFFWICVWAGVLHILSAMVGLVSLVWKVTPFTSQIFELFIAITFIYSSLRDLIQPIDLGGNDTADGTDEVPVIQRSAGYGAFFIGMITCWIAWSFHFAETWIFFSRPTRNFLTSYNTLIAVVLATAFSYIPGFDQDGALERVNVRARWDWQPTADRRWLVHPFEGIDAAGIFAAFVPGFMFFLLFIIDHNVSSILTQSPKFNLKKPSAYHWDFFILGITFFPCAILGLPPGNGLIPQAPLHCRALCTREYRTDRYGVLREVVTHCEEQRWSGLGQAALMFVALNAFVIISWIPTGCLFGLLLYLGLSAIHGNEIWERFLLMFVNDKNRPQIPVVRYVNWFKVKLWTLIQVACAGAIFAVAQFASVGYLYPALLTLLVPFRSYILYQLFPANDLRHLDPEEETEEEFHEEQRLVHHAFHDGDALVDGEELAFPSRAEFHGQALKRVLMNHNRRHTIGHGEPDEILNVEVAKAVIDMELDDTDGTANPLEVIIPKGEETFDAKMKASANISHLVELEQQQESGNTKHRHKD